MDNTGVQLHPNWRALATVHIPMKRFIREGTQQTEHGKHDRNKEIYKIQGINGTAIKEFYEELVIKRPEDISMNTKSKPVIYKEFPEQKLPPIKEPFEVRNYFRYAMENKVEHLKLMNMEGQNINISDNFGWTSLMMAACEGAYQTVEFLLTLGVDKHIKDKTGKAAKDLAQKKGYFKIVSLLDTSFSKETQSEDHIDEKQTLARDPFYCDICKRNFTESSKRQHQTSTVHQFNMKSILPANKLQRFNIPPRNRGLQLMVKQGWDKESGLGPSQTGRLYPVKTVIRKQRTGLGIEQESARVTHYDAFDRKAVERHNSDYYRKKSRNRNDIRREKVREWKRDRRLRNELN